MPEPIRVPSLFMFPAVPALFVLCAGLLPAQDTKYPPKGQLIPAPDCFSLKGAWEGGSALAHARLRRTTRGSKM